jgi:hypothetical protein
MTTKTLPRLPKDLTEGGPPCRWPRVRRTTTSAD